MLMMNPAELQHLCLGCMEYLQQIGETCPNCGWVNGLPNRKGQLIPGSILAGRYLVGKSLGEGGFGIAYIGRSIIQNKKVAIKEFFPSQDMVRRDKDNYTVVPKNDRNITQLFEGGKKKFFNEAQLLARFDADPNIVSAVDSFQENNTAYIVMEFLKGNTLMKHMEKFHRPLGLEELFNIMDPVVDALERLHAQKILHRDISPDNIMISDKGTKILDFGAARGFSLDGHRSNTVFVKFGYAPEEQFMTHGHQGPWTDEHALAATIYHAITAQIPPNLTLRDGGNGRDTLTPPSQFGIKISPEREKILMKGMALNYKNRYPTVRKFSNAFKSGKEPGFSWTKKILKIFFSSAVGDVFDWIPSN